MKNVTAGPRQQDLGLGKRCRLRRPTNLNPRPVPKWVEWLSCFTGLLGSALLASKGEYAGLGFVAYLTSNVGWVAFGVSTRNWPIVLMQLGFTATSILGIKNYLLP